MVVVLRLMFLLKNLINCKFPKVQSYTFAVLILKTCPFSYQNHLLLEPINCLFEIFLCTENIQVLDKFKKNCLTYIAKYIYIYILNYYSGNVYLLLKHVTFVGIFLVCSDYFFFYSTAKNSGNFFISNLVLMKILVAVLTENKIY